MKTESIQTVSNLRDEDLEIKIAVRDYHISFQLRSIINESRRRFHCVSPHSIRSFDAFMFNPKTDGISAYIQVLDAQNRMNLEKLKIKKD